MTTKSKLLLGFYCAIALISLVACWWQNAFYFQFSFLEANIYFITDLIQTPSSRSITIDIVSLFITVSVWMFVEGKKLGMRHVWAYVVFGLIIAISFTFPLFLAVREKRLQRTN